MCTARAFVVPHDSPPWAQRSRQQRRWQVNLHLTQAGAVWSTGNKALWWQQGQPGFFFFLLRWHRRDQDPVGGGIQLIHTFWYFIWIYTNRANTSSEGSVLFFPIHHFTAYNSQIVHPLMTAFPHFFTYILEEADFRRASVLHWFDFWKQEPNPYEEGHDPGTRPRVQCPTKGPAIMTHLY